MSSDTLQHGASAGAVPDITINECQAMRYLAADGYTYREIRLALQVGEHAIQLHTTGECTCPDVDEPVTATPLVGEELRRKRYAADLTQAALAEEIGVRSATISTWEREGSTDQHQRHAHALRGFFEDGDSDA